VKKLSVKKQSVLGVFGVVLAGFGVAALYGACAPAPEAGERTGTNVSAIDGYDQCAKVLEGDIFNKITTSEVRQNAAFSRVWSTLLNMSESEAYDKYLKYYDETHGWTAEGSGSYYGDLFGLEASGGEQRRLTREEFGQTYRQMKSIYRTEDLKEHAENNSFLSAHASYIRDPASIDAWRACVTLVAKSGIYAYGERDESGHAGIHVVWVPGEWGGLAPSVDVTFVNQSGYVVEVTNHPEKIAIGSGKRFAILPSGGDINKAFDVAINSEVRQHDTGELLQTGTALAKIPSTEPHWLPRPGPAVAGAHSVEVMACDPSNTAQQWSLQQRATGENLVNGLSGQAVTYDDSPGSPSFRRRAVTEGLVPVAPSQRHERISRGDSVNFRNVASNKVLDVRGIGGERPEVYFEDLVDNDYQRWEIKDVGGGWRLIKNVGTGKCLVNSP
jgi:hypothetical protein